MFEVVQNYLKYKDKRIGMPCNLLWDNFKEEIEAIKDAYPDSIVLDAEYIYQETKNYGNINLVSF